MTTAQTKPRRKRAPKPAACPPEFDAVILRQCAADMTSHDGRFTWPREGLVTAPDAVGGALADLPELLITDEMRADAREALRLCTLYAFSHKYLGGAEPTQSEYAALRARVQAIAYSEPEPAADPDPMPEGPLRALEYVAVRLGLSLPTTRRRVKDGTIRVTRLGGRVLVSDEEISRVLRAAEAAPPPAPMSIRRGGIPFA